MSNSIDYSPATADLEKVMYKVSEQPIYSKMTSPGSLFPEHNFNEIPKNKAIVNTETGEVISVVSSKYKLLSNEKALELGKDAFTQIFTSVKRESLIPFKVITPSTLASCHIDLIHQKAKISHSKWKQDTWIPFLRVSNSYNRSIAFTLEMGFVRELCANGMIFSKKTMRVKMYHTGKFLKVKIEGLVQPLKQLEEEFVNYLIGLKEYDQIDKKYVLPLICKVLGLKFNLEAENEKIRIMEQKKFENTKSIIEDLTKTYFDELSNTAYAVLNILTDIISHNDDYKLIPSFKTHVNTYYQKPDQWMRDFSHLIKEPNFKMEDYVGDYMYLVEN